VLVIPVEFPTELKKQCPDPALPCFSPAWLASVGPPRHTPEEWATLLNTVATSYWEQSTYNETKFEFTVLNDPETADGWWPAPHSMQDYYRSPSNWGPSTTSPPSYPMGIDVPSAIFSKICENPLLFEVCAVLPTYERFVVIVNQHEFVWTVRREQRANQHPGIGTKIFAAMDDRHPDQRGYDR